ncbi:MAG: hypothetical protein WC509_01330 [Candidatus Izemoplasmatales bacterium]
MTWDQVKFVTELITFMIVAISAVSSTVLFFKSKNMMREKETFDYIDDKFLDYMKMCLERPRLDVFDIPDRQPVELTEAEKKQEKIAFASLLNIFERVYIFYVDDRKHCDEDQLVGWTRTIRTFFARENFRQTWKEDWYGWDAGFIFFMDRFYLEAEHRARLREVKTVEDLSVWYGVYEKCFEIDFNNDTFEKLRRFFDDRGQHPYRFDFIVDGDDAVVGGMLTQSIGNAVVILYHFLKEEARAKGLGTLALKCLRDRCTEDQYLLAEVEKRNAAYKPWWLSRMFLEVDMDYYVPNVDETTRREISAEHCNDLVIQYAHPVSPRDLRRTLRTYLRTSFLHDPKAPIRRILSVRNNDRQLRKMGRALKLKG